MQNLKVIVTQIDQRKTQTLDRKLIRLQEYTIRVSFSVLEEHHCCTLSLRQNEEIQVGFKSEFHQLHICAFSYLKMQNLQVIITQVDQSIDKWKTHESVCNARIYFINEYSYVLNMDPAHL